MFATKIKLLMKKVFLAFSALTLVLVSCKKDDKDEAVTPTKENLTGSYKMTAATISQSGSTVDAYNQLMEACDRDDIYKLNADNSYVVQDAGTVCSPSNDDTGTWSLSGTTINMDGEVGTIKSWNGKTLVVEGTDQGISFSSTYVKQ